jgi:hypothetical protein
LARSEPSFDLVSSARKRTVIELLASSKFKFRASLIVLTS